MAFEQKPNTGSLFKNDRKEADTHPDYKGSALIDGLGDCWLDAWINTAKDGSKYMSLKIKPKEARNGDTRKPSFSHDPTTGGAGGTFGEDIDEDRPF